MFELFWDFLTQYWFIIVLLSGAGLVAGFMGGLFGIGGGIVLVPSLYGLFTVLSDDLSIRPEVRLTAAIATSLAVIVVTAMRSLGSHHKAGFVDNELLKNWLPWVAVGSFTSGFVAEIIPKQLLTLIFAAGALYVGYSRIAGKRKPSGHKPALTKDAPLKEKAIMKEGNTSAPPKQGDDLTVTVAAFLGVMVGFFSSLMGLGGGAAGVLIMGWAGRSIHQSVATASGFGLGVAIPGALGFILAGFGEAGLPPASLGYVNIPAFVMLATMTALTAPIGARLSHSLNLRLLSMLFGVYVLVMALGMLYDAIKTV